MNRESWIVGRAFCRAAIALVVLLSGGASANEEPLGIVIMHGKGGSPEGLVAGLAETLAANGYRVANIEMPWSGRRQYDVPVDQAEKQVDAAIAGVRAKGAGRVFVAGHSQGGVFALHLGGRMRLDGIIAIAPGGSSGSRVYREKLADSVARARQRVAENGGSRPEPLADYEGSRGIHSVMAIPAAYLTWFDPEGAMNLERAARAVSPDVPVLFIVPTHDYPGLLRTSPGVYRLLPRHSRTRLYEPEAGHGDAPTASAAEIMRWTREVAAATAPR